jgi:hypothetical protein
MSAVMEYRAAVPHAGADAASHCAALLGAYEHNARTAIRWAHPSWLASVLAIREDAAVRLAACIDMPASDGRMDALQACSSAMLRMLELPIPTLDAFSKPGVARLDALPPELGLGVLRMRALHFRRAEVRRVIDRYNRTRLSEWLGIPLDRLTDISRATLDPSSAPDIARLAAKAAVPPLETLDAEALALEGHALLKRDLGTARSPCPLLRTALPRERRASHRQWLDTVPPGVDADGTAWLLENLGELLRE